MPSLNFDLAYLTNFLVRLLNTPSPTGLAGEAVQLTKESILNTTRLFAEYVLAD